MFVILFSAYQKNNQTGKIINQGEQSDIEISNCPPTNSTIYHFNTYNDIHDALTKSYSKGQKALRFQEEKYGKIYQATLDAFESNRLELLVPKLNGTEMKLRNKEGFSSISLFTREAYNLPWICYFCVYNNMDVTVRIAYPSVLNNKDLADAESYVDILKVIAPNAPMPSNYQSYKNYKNVYEKDIRLADSRTVSALVSELNDSKKLYISFVIDNALVTLYAEDSVFSDEFWGGFTISHYQPAWPGRVFSLILAILMFVILFSAYQKIIKQAKLLIRESSQTLK